MEQKKNNVQKADVTSVSQPIAKLHVVRSLSMSNMKIIKIIKSRNNSISKLLNFFK
jgi:hypothetical protein